MLTYRELAPPARLAPFIRCFWTLTGAHDGGAERILPDGSFELEGGRLARFAAGILPDADHDRARRSIGAGVTPALRYIAAVAEIRRTRGNLRIRNLSSHLGTTERTLERAFTDVVGIGPKQFARIERFRASLHSDDGLAFYDQSHRIHEFRALAGVTPTEFRREQHAVNDAFVGNLQS